MEKERRFCGVYVIRSSEDDVNSYVGSVFRTTFEVRFLVARLDAERSRLEGWDRRELLSKLLSQHALNAVITPLVVGNFTKREVLELEQKLIDNYKPTLNKQRAFCGIGKASDPDYPKRHYQKYKSEYISRGTPEYQRTRRALWRGECKVCGGVTNRVPSLEREHFWTKRHQRQLLSFLG